MATSFRQDSLSSVKTDPSFGQLYPAERALVRAMVLARRPRIALEVGTWKGGGSTFQIASALAELGAGELHTCEPDEALNAIAARQYAEADFVHVHREYSQTLIARLIADGDVPDFLFFDGPDDPRIALDDLRALESHLTPGTVFMMHDWDDIKASAVRPYIEQSARWQIVSALSSARMQRVTTPHPELRVRLSRRAKTVGIVAAVRLT
jgi:predicted O-methyltransferase YrrM